MCLVGLGPNGVADIDAVFVPLNHPDKTANNTVRSSTVALGFRRNTVTNTNELAVGWMPRTADNTLSAFQSPNKITIRELF